MIYCIIVFLFFIIGFLFLNYVICFGIGNFFILMVIFMVVLFLIFIVCGMFLNEGSLVVKKKGFRILIKILIYY